MVYLILALVALGVLLSCYVIFSISEFMSDENLEALDLNEEDYF